MTTLALTHTLPAGAEAVPRSETAPGQHSADDAVLVMAARGGDRDAFGRLVTRYAGPARRVAYSILGNAFDADDAAQDAFLLAWRKLETFDQRRPFRPWLMRIVVNAATDLYRRRKVRHTADLPESAATDTAGPDRHTERSILRDRLATALADLTDRQRVAVTMYDGEGYSHAEIADSLDVPVGTVRSLVYHARRALRVALAPYGD